MNFKYTSLENTTLTVSGGVGSMRRGPGIAGLQKKQAAKDHFRLAGDNVAKVRADVIKIQLETFRSQLEDFARKHKNDIRKNPTFRTQFHEMCAKVGVDPLASNKGFWAELLGIGDFYYELGVQIVDICLQTRSTNGGLIDLQELCRLLCQRRKVSHESLSEDDCLRAISKLKGLGSGFEVLSVGKKRLVQGYVTVEKVQKHLGWPSGPVIDALDTLLKEGLAMVDDEHMDRKRRYWFPCVSSASGASCGYGKDVIMCNFVASVCEVCRI